MFQLIMLYGTLLPLSNGKLTVYFNTEWGGAIYDIVYLETSLIDHYDTGRLLQVAYYDGRRPFRWDPVEGGSIHSIGSQMLYYEYYSKRKGIHILTQARDWKTDKLLPVIIEKWIEFADTTVIKYVYKMHYYGKEAFYPASNEHPCLYGTSIFNSYEYYGGDYPWTNDEVSTYSLPYTHNSFMTKESWIALRTSASWHQGNLLLTLFSCDHLTRAVARRFYQDTRPSYIVLADPFEVCPGWNPTSSGYIIIGNPSETRKWIYQKEEELRSEKKWDFLEGLEGWKPNEFVSSFTSSERILKFCNTGTSSYILSPTNLSIDARKFKTIAVRMKTTCQGSVKLYFINEAERNWDEEKKRVVPLLRDTLWHTYVFDMTDCPYWDGWIYQLKLEIGQTPGSTEIEYIHTSSGINFGWDFSSNIGSFRPGNDIEKMYAIPDSGYTPIIIKGTINPDPYIISTGISGVKLSDFRFIKIRLRAKHLQVGQVFYRVGDMLHFDEEHSVRFAIIPNSKWHTYWIPIGRFSDIDKNLYQLRFDPGGGIPNDTIDIDYIYLVYKFPSQVSGTTNNKNKRQFLSQNRRNLCEIRMLNFHTIAILSDSFSKVSFTLYDVAGRKRYRRQEIMIKKRYTYIHLPLNLSSGIYFAVFSYNGIKLAVKKVEIIR